MSNHSSVFIISLIISNRFFRKLFYLNSATEAYISNDYNIFHSLEKLKKYPSGERCVERKPVIYSTNTYFMLKYQTQ